MDSRGFFMLPQSPEQSGYYTYGTPARGEGQFAHPKLISLVCLIEHRWQSLDTRKIGMGNKGHRSGLEVDIRILRKDGNHMPVNRFDPQYDHASTAKLIQLFFESAIVQAIYFNDLRIRGVQYARNHDDHFHITVRA
jgi:hypothetical protein